MTQPLEALAVECSIHGVHHRDNRNCADPHAECDHEAEYWQGHWEAAL